MNTPQLPARRRLKAFIEQHQRGRCLVCPFPLLLGYHVHHIIARDDRGPNHPLNLVGVCANHHLALEMIRRHIAPSERHSTSSWMARAKAAVDVLESLDGVPRQLFERLAAPHPLRQPIREGVAPEFQYALARDLAKADSELLVAVNMARPSAVIAWSVAGGRTDRPDGEVAYAQCVAGLTEAVCASEVQDVVRQHLLALHLPPVG